MNKLKSLIAISSLFFASLIFSQAVYEDLVVTATKKESSLMDTPAAIAAIAGDDLNNRGITDISGLNQLSPELVIAGEGHSRTNVRIRGIGTYGFTSAADPSSVIVIDGIAQPRVSSAKHAFRDLERLEVLKGPQGALYGTNALGGIINIVTKKPMGGESGSYSIAYGDNGDSDISLNLETDLTDKTSVRFSLARGYDDGLAFEETTGQDDGVEYTFGRISLFGTYDNGVEWQSAFSHSKDNQDAAISEQDFLCNSTNPASHLLIVAAVQPAGSVFCKALETGVTPADRIKRGDFDENNDVVKASLARKDSQPMNIPGYNFSELINASYSAKMDLDNNRTFRALFGYNKVNSGELRDFDATTVNALNQGHHASSDTYSIELRLDSDPTIRTPWSIGLYGMQDYGYREDHFTSFGFGVPNFLAFGAGAFAYIQDNNPTRTIVNGAPFYTSDAASGNVTMPTAATPTNAALIATWLTNCVSSGTCQAYARPAADDSQGNPTTATQRHLFENNAERQFIDANDLANVTQFATPGVNEALVRSKTQATAINGNITIPLADNMSLLLAGRYSVHEKPYYYGGKTNKDGQPLLVQFDFLTKNKTQEKEFDPKITLEMTNGDALSWLTYATGYKAGGIGFAKWSKEDANKPYAAEKLAMIEAGYKTTLNNGSAQFEAIVYNYDYEDHQQLLVCDTLAGPAGCVINGDATLRGIDLSYRTFLSDNTSLGVAYAFTDATWDKFIDTACCGVTSAYDRSGQQMPFVAENNLLLNLEHLQNTSIGDITYNLNVSHKDEYSVQLDRWEGVTLVEDLTLVNANISLMTNNGIEISAFCTNCSDEEYLGVSLMGVRSQGGGARTAYAEGRRIGMQLSSNF
tara:strand:+ start:64 stop:2661 length:2598 start_codon:yes stop_codon:yes gene_type:complete